MSCNLELHHNSALRYKSTCPQHRPFSDATSMITSSHYVEMTMCPMLSNLSTVYIEPFPAISNIE